MRLSAGELLEHCLAKPGAWQDEPWEGDVVAKVGDKIFAFLGSGTAVGVKCGNNREEADELVDTFPDDVSKSAYIGRSGWNTVRLGGSVPDDEILELVDTSYETIVAKLPNRGGRDVPDYSGEIFPLPVVIIPTGGIGVLDLETRTSTSENRGS